MIPYNEIFYGPRGSGKSTWLGKKVEQHIKGTRVDDTLIVVFTPNYGMFTFLYENYLVPLDNRMVVRNGLNFVSTRYRGISLGVKQCIILVDEIGMFDHIRQDDMMKAESVLLPALDGYNDNMLVRKYGTMNTGA